MVWCNRCDVKVLSKKRYFYKGDGEVWKSLEIRAAKRMKFHNIEDEGEMDGSVCNRCYLRREIL